MFMQVTEVHRAYNRAHTRAWARALHRVAALSLKDAPGNRKRLWL